MCEGIILQDYHSHIVLWESAPVRIIDVRHGLLRQNEHVSIPCANVGAFVYSWGQAGELCAGDTVYAIRKRHVFHLGEAGEFALSSSADWLEYYIVSYQAEFPLFSRTEMARLMEAGDPFSASYGFCPSSPVFFTSCFKEMADSWRSQIPLERLRVKVLFYKMVYQLYFELHGKKGILSRPDAFLQAKRFIDEHYSEPIAVGTLTDLLQISAAHLNRLFKNHTGQSPRQYLMHLRMTTAEELLATSSMTLGEISGACGFQDKFHLSHVFKDKSGLPPGAYRRANHRQPLIKNEIGAAKKSRITIINLYRVTQYDSVPERIVCLSYPEAEICVALGLAGKIAGIASAEGTVEDCFRIYREKISMIPVIPNDSPGRQLPAFETICKLQPDFVYGTAYAFRADAGIANPGGFERNGARIYAAKGTYTLGCTLGDVYEDIC